MSLRPKTKRRLMLLAVIAVVSGSAVAELVSVRTRHHEAWLQQIRAEGMTAYRRGDFRTAERDLRKYLVPDRVDPEALLAYAVSRGSIPQSDQSHLVNERNELNRYLETQPDDDDARHKLLDVCVRLHAQFDTITVANKLLADKPDDVPALTADLSALTMEGKFEEALAIAQRLDRVTPLDCQAQGTTLNLMHLLGRPAPELDAAVDKLAAAYPGDPRVDLIRAFTASLDDKPAEAKANLETAAGKPSPDDGFTLVLARTCDLTGLWDQSTALLAAAESHRDPALTAYTARRLYHAGQTEAALARLGPVTADTPSPLLGLRAMILAETTHDRAAVAALTQTLSNRPDDTAAAWVTLLPAVTADPPLPPRDRVIRCDAAGRLDPGLPETWFRLGTADRDLGETELAVQKFRVISSGLAPDWAGADLAIASGLLDEDRAADATTAAHRAADRDPKSGEAAAAVAVCDYRLLSTAASLDQTHRVLAEVRRARAARPDDARLAAAEVDLLARGGDLKTASTVAVTAVNSPSATPAVLSRLAAVAAADQLDIGPELVERAKALQPGTPEAAYDRSIAMATVGDPAAGRTALDPFAGRGPDWQLALLQYRDATANPATTDLWASLADANPKDLALQRAVLRSPTAAASRPLTDRTIDRLRACTGDEGLSWKLARARWQLAAPDEPREDVDAVIVSMAEVSKNAPTYADPLVIWAEALEKNGDLAGATDRLRTAAGLEPADPGISLRLARLLVRQGHAHDAGEVLDPVAGDGHLSPEAAVATAELLDRVGHRDRAVALLDRTPPTAAADLLRARLAAEVDPARADQTYATFAKSTDPALVTAASRRLAGQGKIADGRALIGRLDTMLPSSQALTARGEFESDFGAPAAAAEAFTAAAGANPADPKPWRAWAAAALRHRDWTSVADVTTRGLAANPGDKPLAQLAAAAVRLKALSAGPEFSPLIQAIAANPADPAAAATLDAAGSAADLSSAVDHYPAFWPARAMLAQRMMSAGRYQEAADAVGVAVAADPSDPAPVELLTRIWATAGHWDRALEAAGRWKDRTAADPAAADLAIAVADLHLGRGDATVNVLTPYLPAARAAVDRDPDGAASAGVILDTVARGLTATGRTDRAASLLEGPARKSVGWRRRWLRVIADSAESPAAAGTQIDRVEQLVPAGTIDERLALADTWYRLADRCNDKPSAQRALEILDPLTDTDKPPVDVWVLLGAVQQQLGDLAAAEAADRQALAVAPSLPRVQNNLAQIILLRNEDPATAEPLAAAAVKADPSSPAAHETLAETESRLGRIDDARREYTAAVAIDPDNVPALIGLAEIEQKTSEPDRAIATARQARDAIDTGRRRCPDGGRARLDQLAAAIAKARGATVDVGGQ